MYYIDACHKSIAQTVNGKLLRNSPVGNDLIFRNHTLIKFYFQAFAALSVPGGYRIKIIETQFLQIFTRILEKNSPEVALETLQIFHEKLSKNFNIFHQKLSSNLIRNSLKLIRIFTRNSTEWLSKTQGKALLKQCRILCEKLIRTARKNSAKTLLEFSTETVRTSSLKTHEKIISEFAPETLQNFY